MHETNSPRSSHDFPRRARLLSAEDFKKTLRGRRTQGQWVLVCSCRGVGVLSRLGIVVGRRAVASAVERNRIKRVVRETFRRLDAQRTLDIVVRVRSNPGRQDGHAFRAELQQMLSGLLC